jgi:SagB-type dehydrogenase family enzyme
MNNADVEQAWAYHDGTKHSERSIRADAHYLDWANRPRPLKIYSTLEPIPLPGKAEQTGIAALSAIAEQTFSVDAETAPTMKDLARILYFSAGITKVKRYPGGEIQFRAASCTGALYEFDLYLVCGDLPDLDAGVYHFGPADFVLRRLRKGDFRSALVHATAGESHTAHAPLTVVCAGTYWRNSWKYRARTYRHFGWDNGTLLANMLAISSALGLPASVVCGFADMEVNRLLDLDIEREVAFSLVPIGYVKAAAPEITSDIPKLDLPTEPVSKNEVDYPPLRMIHGASSLQSYEEVQDWRGRTPAGSFAGPLSARPLIPLRPLDESEMPRDLIEQVILRRGSSRQFERESIPFTKFSTVLDRATRGIRADFLDPPGTQINDLYIIVNAVEGLNPGSYVFHRDRRALECLREGNFRSEAQHLGLQQELPGDASAAIFLLADLKPILARYGNRGYRAAQLEAGIIGGRLYLAAYAIRIGATGLTFFDDDVTDFFSPHAAGKSAIFLVAIGKGVRPGLEKK